MKNRNFKTIEKRNVTTDIYRIIGSCEIQQPDGKWIPMWWGKEYHIFDGVEKLTPNSQDFIESKDKTEDWLYNR